MTTPKVYKNRFNHTVSLVAAQLEMYSASMVDKVTQSYFLLDQDIAPPPNMNTNPEVDFRSFGSLAQSVSEYPRSRKSDP